MFYCRVWGVWEVHIKNMENISDVLGVLGFAVAMFSLCVSVWQYKLHKRQMKTELLSKYCARYCINKEITAVVRFIEKKEGLSHRCDVEEPDDHEVEIFMRFFEELELLIRAKSLDEKIVYYIFFYYVQTFVKIKDKWKRIDYESDNWKVFHEFYSRMKKINSDNTNYKIN